MRSEKFWQEHPSVYSYIENNWEHLKDFELATNVNSKFNIDIDPEKIRWLRRDKNWKKRISPNGENANKFEKSAFITCLHIPFHDPKLFALFLVFLKYFKPDRLWILGDVVDWTQVGRWPVDPKRLDKLQDDLDSAINILNIFGKLVPKIELFGGNHEERMIAFLKDHPRIHSLRALQVPALLELYKTNIKYHPYMQPPLKYHGLQIHHGTLIRKHSGWTAKAHYEKYGGCGIIGHCHRGGSYIKRNTLGVFGWWENMCMCSLKPHYSGFVDWIQGWSIAYFTKKDLFHLEQIPVINHKFLWQGKLFEV